MGVHSFKELRAHVGHKVEVVTYAEMNVAIECIDCNEVLLDFDSTEVFPVTEFLEWIETGEAFNDLLHKRNLFMSKQIQSRIVSMLKRGNYEYLEEMTKRKLRRERNFGSNSLHWLWTLIRTYTDNNLYLSE